MLTSARLAIVAVAAPLALLAGCTFASPTTSTYNAGKAAAVDAGDGLDGGSASTSSPSSTGSTGSSAGSTGSAATDTDTGTLAGGTTCCAEPDASPEGTCIPTAAIPAASASFVEQDTCATGNACVPTSQVNGTPTKCGLIDGLFGGVCMGTCFSTYLSLASVVLTSSECGPDDACVPCEALSGRGVAGCDE